MQECPRGGEGLGSSSSRTMAYCLTACPAIFLFSGRPSPCDKYRVEYPLARLAWPLLHLCLQYSALCLSPLGRRLFSVRGRRPYTCRSGCDPRKNDWRVPYGRIRGEDRCCSLTPCGFRKNPLGTQAMVQNVLYPAVLCCNHVL